MKRLTLSIYTFLLISFLNQLFAQPNQDSAMKAWMSYMTPGDVHKMLAKDDGEWLRKSPYGWHPAPLQQRVLPLLPTG